MSKHGLTGEQWAVIEPLIPKKSNKRDHPHNEDLPRKYGSDSTCW